MEKVDAKKELDTMFAHLSDVIHFVGITTAKDDRGRSFKVAFARLILPNDGPLRPWPKKLVYKLAVEISTGLKMFLLCEPERPMDALLTAEWEDSYQSFVDVAEQSGVFMVEIVTPKRKLGALVVGDAVKDTAEHQISPEDYEILQNSYTVPPKAPSS